MPFFNNSNKVLPGAYTKTDATGLITTSLAPGGIVGMIGTAYGGEPGSVYRFTSSALAEETFKSGKLLDAMKAAWLNGANDIYAIRIGAAARSTITLTDSTSGEAIILESKDYGSWTNSISVKIETGSSLGYKLSIRYIDSTNKVTLESSTGVNKITAYDNIANIAELATVITENSQLVQVNSIVDATKTLVSINYTNFTQGSDGLLDVNNEITTTLSDWTNALKLYETYAINILNPAGTDSAEVHALFLQHCIEMSSKEMQRMCVVGGGATDSVGDVTNPGSDPLSSIGRAYNLNHERIIYVATGVNDEKAAYTASLVTGKLAGFDPATSLTFKTLNGITSLNTKYTQTNKEDLITRGCIILEDATAGRRIIRDVTTIQDIRLGLTEEAFKDITTVRISDYVSTNLKSILQDLYVGKKGLSGATNAMANTCVDVLSNIKEAEVITNYRNISVSADPSNPKIYRVSCNVVPVFTITWIFITTTLTNT